MLFVVRRLLPRWLRPDALAERGPSLGIVAAVLLFMTGSALATEILGIHALFGAFLAGAIMPRDEEFRRDLVVRMENFTSVLLMPLFFAFSGLRTHIGMLNDTKGWLICLAIVGVATAGKLGSSMFSARLIGMGWNDAFAFGALMNTRGLMELIALNIGYDLGVLPTPIFTILVLMALFTTFMTGPLMNLAEHIRLAPRAAKAPEPT
jgi:Kef-type K+ transport system membrane component KefB